MSQSNIFKYNFMYWKIFGIWPGLNSVKHYVYFSTSYLCATFLIYNILLTLNLFYTPPKIELLIREVIFYFTEIVVLAKVLMILLKRDKILKLLSFLNREELQGDCEATKAILNNSIIKYKTCYKLYNILSNAAYSSQVFLPIFVNMVRKNQAEKELPICKYYFLSDETRQAYFVYWFIYQSFGMYGHMTYNVNIDSFIAGLLLMSITHLRMLKFSLKNFKLSDEEQKLHLKIQDALQIKRLKGYLKYYELILEYNATIQEVIGSTMFVQFGIASTIICVVMCGLLLPSSMETFAFMVMYLCVMTMQIYLPGYLGALLTYESQELTFAAYNCEWVSRSKSFKGSLLLFMLRTNNPTKITGLKIFPLSLVTFTSIMKTAYSFFTLIRNVQDQQQQ